MPELPDVEVYKRYMNATSLHRRILAVNVRNRKILKDISPAKLRRRLQSCSFQSTARHGKHLFVKTDTDRWLMLHFGMTGSLRYFKNEQRADPHARIVIGFRNGYKLALVCPRLFGSVRLITSPVNFVSENRLGPDALSIDCESFEKILQISTATAKSTLMNQRRIAGIGNIYSDEILFQSNVHPKTPTNELTVEQIRKIYRNMSKVLSIAIERKANPNHLPRSYLLPHRRKDGCCPRCHTAFACAKIGRTAYFCPNCQPEA
jgi:formamidopyrimidine-DNA glycosylase